MSQHWQAEFPRPGTDVVFKITALWSQQDMVGLEGATQIVLPPVWITGKQVLCLSLTEDGRIKAEIVAGDQ